MYSENIKDEKTLVDKLTTDVTSTSKAEVLLVAGHFPLVYEPQRAVESFSAWGDFSTYSLELACIVAEKARDRGKKITFAFFADDHTYATTHFTSLNATQRSKKRHKLYQSRSGKNAQLPAEYKKMMGKYHFSEKDVLRHDHKKSQRQDCLYFSELVLRASPRAVENACAREYIEFLENPLHFNKEESYLVSFVPDRCTSNVCRFVMDSYANDISATHIFMQTDNLFFQSHGNREHIWKEWGVLYRKEDA